MINFIVIFVFLFSLISNISLYSQNYVINSKGTLVKVDTSSWNISNNNIYNKNTGNVGIGIMNPNEKLDIQGNIKVSDTIKVSTIKMSNTTSGTGSDSILTIDPATGIVKRVSPNRIGNNFVLNGLNATSQTFATGTSGSDFNIVSSGSTHSFNLPDASATNRGALTSADWTTFNSKIGTVTATTPAAVVTSGTSATVQNTLPLWNANQLQGSPVASTAPSTNQTLVWNGTAWTPTSGSVSNTVTAPNSLTTTVNGTTGAPVNMVTGVSNTSDDNTLTTTVNGVVGSAVNIINSNTLTAASNAITSTVNGVSATLTPTAGGTITENLGFNSSGALVRQTVNAANTPNIYTTDGTLAANRTVTQEDKTLAFTSTATTGTSHFTVDGTTFNVNAVNNRVGIGTNNPADALEVVANSRFPVIVNSTNTGGGGIAIHPNNFSKRVELSSDTSGNFHIWLDTNRLYILRNGNVGLGTNSPTERLQVEGNLRFSQALKPNNNAGTIGQVLTSNGDNTAPTWTTPSTASYGDIKYGIQTSDHSGWILLNGRAKSTLTASQQTIANSLGIGPNLPNALNSVLMQNGNTLGSVSGSNTRMIAQNNLPNVDLPLLIDNATATNQNAGAHNHTFKRPNGLANRNDGNGNTWWGYTYGVTVTTSTNGDHTHLQNPHTHTGKTKLNGGVTQEALDITPQALSVNVFIYLGN